MPIENFKNKLVAVLGYGMEGKAVTNYLLKHGLKPVLFDQKPWTEWGLEEQNEIKSLGVNFIFGPDAFLELAGFNVAFRSPGVRLDDKNLVKFIKKGLEITSQTKFFFDNCPGRIIGVTGTKGKGTTSSLIYEILKEQAKSSKTFRPFLTGNIGKEQPLAFLDSLDPEDVIVYELSSFQLQDLTKSPHIAVVLMVTSEHLDYHLKIKAYHAAKAPITKYQGPKDFAIINYDFPASMAIGACGKAKKLYFSRRKTLKLGAYVEKDAIVIVEPEQTKTEVVKISKIQLRGSHNLENVCAAVLAAKAGGCSIKAIKNAAAGFKGLEHRLEFVAEKSGVKFYNDSFSTIPETTIAAIESFSEPLILILGGSSKGSNFVSLAKTVNTTKNIKAIILIGQESGKIKDALTKAGKAAHKLYEGAKSMNEIFEQIEPIAKKGDAVLLSPACASFGMFKNYKDRGEQFKAEVKKCL